MTTAAAPHLRPLGLGELLDQAIRLYRRNFLKFIGIIAVVQIPLALLQLLVSLSTVGGVVARAQNPSSVSPDDPLSAFGPGYFAGIGVGLLLGLISFILVQGIAAAATARAVADSYLGEPTGMVEAYRKIGRAWGSILGALLMVVLLFAALLLWTVIPCIGWFTGFGLLFFFAAVIVPLIAPVIVLENQRAVASIRRAWDLARRRFWWTLGFVFILYIFSLLIIAGPTVLLTLLMQALLGNPLQSGTASSLFTLQAVIRSLSGLVLSLLYLPLQVTCITLMYFDLRVRTEGFDLALSAESALGAQAGTAALTLPAPPPESKGLVTWPELGYFVLIELMAVGLYCGLTFLLIFAAMAASGLGP